MNDIIVIGASGFGAEVAWTAREAGYNVVGFCDDARKEIENFLGTVEEAQAKVPGVGFIVSIGDNLARRRLFERAIGLGFVPTTVVAKTAVVSADAVLGEGVYVGNNTIISVNVRVGRGSIVNGLTSVGHDVRIGEFVQICPRCCISGYVEIGDDALLGSNSTVIPVKKIGKGAVLGANSLALRDIPDGGHIVRLR